MKKTYMAPSMEVVEVETTEMLESSFVNELGSQDVAGEDALTKERDLGLGDLW